MLDYEHWIVKTAHAVAVIGVLAAIVGIRTFLSFVLELDVSGSWPWRRARHRPGAGRPG